MATQARRESSRFGRPKDTSGTNAAISTMVAEGVHDQRVTGLKKDYKAFERKLVQSGQVAESHGQEANKFSASAGKASAATNRALEQQAKSIQSLQRKQTQAVKKAEQSIQQDPRWLHLATKQKGKKQTAAQEKYWRRYVKSLPESVSLAKATRNYELAAARAGAASKANQAQLNAYNSRINAANARNKKLNRKYMNAVERYKNAANVVRYTP